MLWNVLSPWPVWVLSLLSPWERYPVCSLSTPGPSIMPGIQNVSVPGPLWCCFLLNADRREKKKGSILILPCCFPWFSPEATTGNFLVYSSWARQWVCNFIFNIPIYSIGAMEKQAEIGHKERPHWGGDICAKTGRRVRKGLQWSERATGDRTLKQGVRGLLEVQKAEQGEQWWKSSNGATSAGSIGHSKDFRLSWMRSEGTRGIDQELV